ncbi:hypothetical protein AAG596_14340 [Citromicrobium bathyomarinum]|uniref:hypothetical protein n=1 Tax=Citromicrobium bathyomarinum TaxID=72174 RepID=UPI00315A1C73
MFDIVGSDIAALGDADLRTLVARLVLAELGEQGLPLSGATAGGNQDAPDGGIDVRVEVAQPMPAPDFVPRAVTGFQVKKPNMTASAISAEMRPKDVLRSVIGDLADAGGAYIIVSAQGSVADAPLAARRKAMRDALKGHPNAAKLHVDFYDRERVATWASQYPGVAAWIRSRLGRELSGWRPIGDWTESQVTVGTPYLCDDRACLIDEGSKKREKLTIADGIARLRQQLSQPRHAIRLIGLSGLGKTRLAQALFETGLGYAPLDPSLAIYTDYSEETTPTAREIARRLVDTDQRAILIVDNCNPATHAELARICAGDVGQVSLLTVEYDVRDDEPERTEVFRLESASPALVEEWLKQNFDHISQVDRGRIASFSDGNFRVARALAETLKRGETLGQLKNRELFERIFQQRNAPDQALLFAAEDLALLYSFDGEDTSPEGELAAIGQARGVTAAHLYSHVAELRRRGIIQSRGRWRAILPHAIANPLAGYALERIPPADFDAFCLALSTRMLKSLSRRLGYLHDNDAAGAAVARWLKSDGPLGDLFALGEPGLEIIRNIAPVSPEAVLAKIDGEIAGPNGARILSTDNRLRGQWISLVKTLAYDPSLFEEAATLLARFVVAEPEGHNHNSASRPFGELFHLHLSGTRATPDQRRDMIRSFARQNDPALKACASRALDHLLETNHFMSSSHLDFGARPRDFGWEPSINGEIFDWHEAAIDLAIELADHIPNVSGVLANNVRGLWRYPSLHNALERACTAFTMDGPWIDGWLSFRAALRYEGKAMPHGVKARLLGIIDRLKPSDLLNRARASVLTRSAGGFDLADSEHADVVSSWRLAAQQAVDLGKAFAGDTDLLATFLPELFSETSPQRAGEFGKGLAEGAGDVPSLWSTLIAAFEAMPPEARNPTVLGGFLAGAARDFQFTRTALDGVAENPAMVGKLSFLQARVGINDEAIARLSAALDAGKIEASDFYQIANGVVRDAPGALLAPLLRKIATLPGGTGVAFDILHMHQSCAQDDGHALDPDLINCGRALLRSADFSEEGRLGDYGVAEVAEICLAGPEGEDDARIVCKKLRAGLDDYSLWAHKLGRLMQALFEAQPMIALDEFLLGDDDDDDDSLTLRFDLHSPVEEVDTAILRAWSDMDPVARYPLVGRSLSLFLGKEFEEEVGLSRKFLELLDHAPDRAQFLGELYRRIHPSGWSGSLAAILERRRAMLEPLASHEDPAVRAWLTDQDKWLGDWIKAERARETESEEAFE